MLITLRRLLALLLVVLFVALFVVTLVACRVNATLLAPSFYTGTLAKLDVYNFLYDQALPIALEEAEVDLGDSGLGISLTNQQAVGYLKRVVPPEWLQEQVEETANEVVLYVTGSQDGFSVTLRFDDRVEEAVATLKDVLRDSEIYDYLLEDVVRPELETSNVLAGLPYGLQLTPAQVIAGVKEVVPEEWLLQQIDQGLDAITPYVTGKSETFAIVIPLQERGRATLTVLERWMGEALEGQAQQYLMNEQIAPALKEYLGGQISFPLGVTLTDQELLDIVRRVLSREWANARISDAFDAFGPYLIGETDSFVLLIPLRERIELAVGLLEAEVEGKYQTLFASLPVCSPQQLLTLVLSLDAPPPCLPPGTTYDLFKQAVGLDVLGQLRAVVVDRLPANIKYTDQSLVQAVGANGVLDDVRRYFKEGYRFTDQDLRRVVNEEFGSDGVQRLDDALEWTSEGLVITESDLQEELEPDDLETLEDTRQALRSFRSLSFLLVVPLVLMAAVVGLLGGRSWWSRLAWAGVPLVVAGVLVAVGLLAGSSVGGGIADDEIRASDLQTAYVDKLLEVRQVVTDAFVGPMVVQSIVVLVLGAVMIGAGIYLALSRRRNGLAPKAAPGV